MDCLLYERQIQQIRQTNEEGNIRYGGEDDYLYRFKSGDRVAPVVTLVLYWGKKPWKKPLGVRDMLDVNVLPGRMKKLAGDYRIHLISIREIPWESLHNMKSDLKYVLGLMKCGNSGKKYEEFIFRNQDYFRRIPKDAVDVLNVCMNISKLTKVLEYHTAESGEEKADHGALRDSGFRKK